MPSYKEASNNDKDIDTLKPSRTLIISNINDDNGVVDIINDLISLNICQMYQEEEVSKYTTLKIITKNSRITGFIECLNINESKNLKYLLETNNIACRFANYRLFLRVLSDPGEFTYTQQKSMIIENLQSLYPEINIMYFKLFFKDNTLTGKGYVVIDRIADMNKLINYTNSNKNTDEKKISFHLDMFVKQPRRNERSLVNKVK